jgi:hypothetical protein
LRPGLVAPSRQSLYRPSAGRRRKGWRRRSAATPGRRRLSPA